MMVTYHKEKTYFSSELPPEIKLFFENTFDALYKELKHLQAKIYPEPHKAVEVFNNIERSWIGIFDNAVIRAYGDNVATLEEFSEVIGVKRYGRADYFVRFKEKIDLLFEAKHYEERGGSNSKMNDEYKAIIDQARKYHKHDRGYKDETYFVALLFGWIRKNSVLDKAMKYSYNDIHNKAVDNCSFAALYSYDEHGIWVYGKVERVEKK